MAVRLPVGYSAAGPPAAGRLPSGHPAYQTGQKSKCKMQSCGIASGGGVLVDSSALLRFARNDNGGGVVNRRMSN